MEPFKTDTKSNYTSDIKNKFQSGENAIVKATHDVGEKMGSMASQLADTASDYYKSSQTYVKANPAKSIAIAVAAGAVAGSLMTFVSRRKV